jgi:hypothetical protein
MPKNNAGLCLSHRDMWVIGSVTSDPRMSMVQNTGSVPLMPLPGEVAALFPFCLTEEGAMAASAAWDILIETIHDWGVKAMGGQDAARE